MNETDDVIDRILHGLRDAQPADGFEQRLLARARHAERSRVPRRPWVFCVARSAVTVAFALVMVFFAAVGFAIFRVYQHIPPMPLSISMAGAPPPVSVALSQRPPQNNLRRAVAAVRKSRPAVKEEVARNLPAPPLPLTEQERLLLRIARRRDPGNVALLNSNVRMAKSTQAMQEFQNFFAMTFTEKRSQVE
jgi:hypothetical protein